LLRMESIRAGYGSNQGAICNMQHAKLRSILPNKKRAAHLP
jgi:hypothetical protein